MSGPAYYVPKDKPLGAYGPKTMDGNYYPGQERDDGWMKMQQFLLDEQAKKVAQQDAKRSTVEAPIHYRFGRLQTIDLIYEVLSKQQDGFIGYCLGNVFKYLTRFGKKDGLQDLKKAHRYLGWMIEYVEKGAISHE